MLASGDLNLLELGGDGLLDLLGLLGIGDDEGVEELAAADLELSELALGAELHVALDLNVAGVLAGADGEEFLKVLDLTGHGEVECKPNIINIKEEAKDKMCVNK